MPKAVNTVVLGGSWQTAGRRHFTKFVERPPGFPPVIDFPPRCGFDIVHGAHAARERVYACFTVGPSATHFAEGETQ